MVPGQLWALVMSTAWSLEIPCLGTLSSHEQGQHGYRKSAGADGVLAHGSARLTLRSAPIDTSGFFLHTCPRGEGVRVL